MATLLSPAVQWRRPGEEPAELIALKARHLRAFVVWGERVPGLPAATEQTLSEWAVGEHANLALPAVRQDIRLDFAVQEVVTRLQRLERQCPPGGVHLRHVEVGD